jgi:hypothetical protein
MKKKLAVAIATASRLRFFKCIDYGRGGKADGFGTLMLPGVVSNPPG